MIGAAKPARVSELPQAPPVLGKCCGLDVHKKSCTAAIISDQKLPILLEGLENNGPGIHQLYQRLVEEGCSTVVMESTGPYWMGVYDYLDLRGINTVLICPRSMKAIRGKKTDEHDAVWLAHLYRLGLVEPSYIPPRHIRELRSLTRRLEKIVHMMAGIKNSIQSQIDTFSTGITTTYTDTFGLNGTRIVRALAQNMDHEKGIDTDAIMARLREEGIPDKKLEYVEKTLRLSFDPTSSGWLIEQGLETLHALGEQRDQVLDRIARHIHQHKDLSRTVHALMSVSGIDMVSATTIASELGDPTRFENGKNVASYFGLVPSVEQSGPITVLGRISRRGSPHMRRILCQVALVISARGSPHLRRWYEQVKKRRGTQKAIVALSRKILVIVWAMLRDNTQFQEPDQYQDPDRAKGLEALYRRKLKEMKERAQRSARTVSVWDALHLLATNTKLRTELGLPRIRTTPTPKPTPRTPSHRQGCRPPSRARASHGAPG
jgi:transposase